jgi:hypothetical protein
MNVLASVIIIQSCDIKLSFYLLNVPPKGRALSCSSILCYNKKEILRPYLVETSHILNIHLAALRGQFSQR